jgi:hypothetical protein
MFLAATIFTRIWRLGNQHYSVQCRLSDFSVKISGSVVLNKLRQGRLVKLSQHAQLAVLVAMTVIDAHEVPLICRVSR